MAPALVTPSPAEVRGVRVGTAVTVGTPAPDFELPDHRGGAVRLHDHLTAGGVVLVFFRGHWCPYCRRYLSKLQSHVARIEAGGARLITVSPEPPGTSAALAADLNLRFPILSDADGQVINRFGTRNGSMGGGSVLPHPSVFVIDGGGLVRLRSVDRNFKKRTTVRTILAALGSVAAAGTVTAATATTAAPVVPPVAG